MPGSDGTIISSITIFGACANAADDTTDTAAKTRLAIAFTDSSIVVSMRLSAHFG